MWGLLGILVVRPAVFKLEGEVFKLEGVIYHV